MGVLVVSARPAFLERSAAVLILAAKARNILYLTALLRRGVGAQ
jgi:hypothetical protein